MTEIVTDVVVIVTRDGRAVQFSRSNFLIRFHSYGVTVVAKPGHAAGWKQRVYPWSNIGVIQEEE